MLPRVRYDTTSVPQHDENSKNHAIITSVPVTWNSALVQVLWRSISVAKDCHLYLFSLVYRLALSWYISFRLSLTTQYSRGLSAQLHRPACVVSDSWQGAETTWFTRDAYGRFLSPPKILEYSRYLPYYAVRYGLRGGECAPLLLCLISCDERRSSRVRDSSWSSLGLGVAVTDHSFTTQ